MKSCFWQVVCCGKFTKEEAKKLTATRGPGIVVVGFRSDPHQLFEGYSLSSWSSHSEISDESAANNAIKSLAR